MTNPSKRCWGSPFTPEEIEHTRASRRLLTMELETSRICNLRCTYCYAEAGQPAENELTFAELTSAVDQAVELGARKIIVLGGGEPLMYPQIDALLSHIERRSVGIELFTNAMFIDLGLANRLYSMRVETVVKMNSLRPDVQDELAGRDGAHKAIRKGMDLLLAAGYSSTLQSEAPALGAQTVICRQNLDELPEMWIWLRQRNIIPYFEMLTDQGRATINKDLHVSPQELEALFRELARIDATRFDNHWEPHPSVAAFTCNRHLYSCTVTSVGDVLPCPGVNVTCGNIREHTLLEILHNSPVISELRDIRQRIKGTCKACEHTAHCYGCRGMAWQACGDYLASDPLCWKNSKEAANG